MFCAERAVSRGPSRPTNSLWFSNMIDRAEIEAKANEFDIHVSNVERDYVFGWLLKAISENAYLSDRLILKGGNAFRKVYFPLTRFSNDLDFSTKTGLELGEVLRQLAVCCSEITARTKVEFDLERMRLEEAPIAAERTIYKGRLYFRDFYGNSEAITISVRLDITEFDRVLLPVACRPLIHPYSDAAACTAEVQCLSLEELVANKLKCLVQRRHSNDLYDVVYAAFVDPPAGLDRLAIVQTFLRKTIFELSPLAAKRILLGIPFAYFRGVWNKYIVCPTQSRLGFDDVESGFSNVITRLFENFSETRHLMAFVEARFRNVILEGGADRKLIQVGYDGVIRTVEPYALAFKRRQDGAAFEYFYAWDRTGGHSGPGIKAFLPHKLESVDLTDDVFEPRFEIELAKAGEFPRQGYFSGRRTFGMGGAITRAVRTNRTSSRMPRTTYKFECMGCGKRFTRQSNNNVMKPHNTPDGYRCLSRLAYQVWD